MSIRELQEQVDALAQAMKQYCSNRSCSCCGGRHNGGNCPNFFNQPPQHQMETYSCEYYGGIPHPGFDCQTGNTPNYDQGPYYNQDFSFNQPPFYSPSQPQQFDCCELCGVMTNLHFILHINNNSTTVVRSVEVPIIALIVKPGTSLSMSLISGSDDYTKVTYDKEQCLSDHYTILVTSPAYTPSLPFLATMEPADTLLIGDEIISTTPVREDDEFIKSNVDNLVPIPREFEVTSDSVLECDMPATTPLPPTNNREVDFDINSPLGE
ncbi:hypothetical protein Tco_0722685 [Tanacetum coccineum]